MNQPLRKLETAPPRQHGFDLLLRVEAEARQAETVAELAFLLANDGPALVHAQQIIIASRNAGGFKIEAISAIGQINRESPRVRWFEGILQRLASERGIDTAGEFELPAYCSPEAPDTRNYPHRFLAFVPMKLRDGYVFAGLLIARDRPFSEADLTISKRLADAGGHAWAALTGAARLRRRPIVRPLVLGVGLITLAACFLPVPLTVLAPVEVRASDPRVIAAPIDGAIAEIAVEPNDFVAAGQVLARLADTGLRNDLAIAEKDLSVAYARLKQITQLALTDGESRSELAVARSETEVALARRDYARELLSWTVIASPAAGVAIFADKQSLVGMPVSTGERLMEIADPGRVRLRIDIAVADVLALQPGAKVRAFLDSDPLHPLTGKIEGVSFEAQLVEGNTLAYRIYAVFDDIEARPHLGVRGTAQVFGANVPLAYSLFRRPIAAIRQRLGL